MKQYFRPALIISFGLFILMAIIWSLISINRYYQFNTFYYDFGIFDMAIWKMAHFQVPTIEHYTIGGSWIFGDHFSPALVFLAPLYWFTSRQEVMFVTQALFAAAAGWVLYLAAHRLTKNVWTAVAVQLCFYLFAGLQNALLTDFHEVVLATLPFSVMIYALVSRRRSLYLWSTLIFLLFKESSSLLAMGLHLYAFITIPAWRKFVFSLSLLGIFYSYLAVKVIIPFFSGSYQYNIWFGLDPRTLLSQFFTPAIKTKTLFDSLASFSFAPIFTPWLWPTYFFHYAPRFLANASSRWDIGMHYNAEIAPIYAFSLMLLLSRFVKARRTALYSLAALIILQAFYQNFFHLKRPFALVYNPALYADAEKTLPVRQLLASLPDGPTIMAQNQLLPHLTHKNLMLMHDAYYENNPDFILFNADPEQNGNNWFGLGNHEKFIRAVENNPDYHLAQEVDGYRLYGKNSR